VVKFRRGESGLGEEGNLDHGAIEGLRGQLLAAQIRDHTTHGGTAHIRATSIGQGRDLPLFGVMHPALQAAVATGRVMSTAGEWGENMKGRIQRILFSHILSPRFTPSGSLDRRFKLRSHWLFAVVSTTVVKQCYFFPWPCHDPG